MEKLFSLLDLSAIIQSLGSKVIAPSGLGQLLILLAFNTFTLFIIINYIYARNTRNSVRQDFYFNFFSIGIIVFLLCYLLNNIKIELGFALGLFAIFRIVHYRTETLPIKEMTYLFIVIGISVINAFANQGMSYPELIFTNGAVIAGLWLVETKLLKNHERSMRLIYEKIENIHEQSKGELVADLHRRTGLNVRRLEIKKIDFLRDSAEIEIFYKEK
ncbi:MAG: DUF4956 domain-containing protein [Calditrichia bacterium]